MTESERAPFRLHEDRALFLEAVSFTAAETDFIPRLIEKDYFCSLLLHELDPNRHNLIFKGGTCLAKVHAGFYRLSEDLDFAIPTPVDASRAERRRRVTPFPAQARSARSGLRRVRSRSCIRDRGPSGGSAWMIPEKQ